MGITLNLDTELLIEKYLSKFLFGFPEIQIAGILLRCDDDNFAGFADGRLLVDVGIVAM